jgi:hypothetical protein
MTFTPVDQPRPVREVLSDAWRNAEGLRGRPDILRINRHLATANPERVRDMAKIGVQVSGFTTNPSPSSGAGKSGEKSVFLVGLAGNTCAR